MTYFGFLLRFLVIPIIILALLNWRDIRQGRPLPPWLRQHPVRLVLLIHVALAVIWTTPWDNYLVANRIWWYLPERVTGITLGWVPIEEYTFFVLQTLLTGQWLVWLGRRVTPPERMPDRPGLRAASLAIVGVIWLMAVAILLLRWQPGTYLALTLIWLLPPIIPQLAVGAHILWHGRRLVIPGLLVPLAYLAAADYFAIGDGIWIISPAHTVNILIGGILPIEEFIFFALTNILIVFGMTLMMATNVEDLRQWIKARIGRVNVKGDYGEA